MRTKITSSRLLFLASLPLILALAGCGQSGDDSAPKIETPAQASSQLDQAFQDANGALKDSAAAAAAAMRKGEYEKAVVSLHTAQQAPNITLNQGLAIHSSMLTLERDLINAIERGDPNAQRAYDLLKRSKRN